MASNELAEQIEAAFDYRGDCTVTLKSGEQVVGYLFNRELAPHPKVAGSRSSSSTWRTGAGSGTPSPGSRRLP